LPDRPEAAQRFLGSRIRRRDGAPPARPSVAWGLHDGRKRKEPRMDLVCILLVAVLVGSSLGLIVLCERL
jgi:hypothetical protein